jgi:hypothetical protein
VRQARLHRQLGDAYEGLGRLPESRQHAEQAVALLGWPVPSTQLRLLADLTGQALRHGCHRIFAGAAHERPTSRSRRPIGGSPSVRATNDSQLLGKRQSAGCQ